MQHQHPAPMQQQPAEQWQKQQAAVLRDGLRDETGANNREPQPSSSVPQPWRAPQPPKRRTMPDWVEDCFVKDEMARKSERLARRPFLREGVAPQVGLSLYLQLTYRHDGSHPEHYRQWGRMMGEITHVYDPPEVGVYALYEGQQLRLTEQELQQQRECLPALPPSVFGVNATCSCCRTAEQVVAQYGALHGQRFKGRMWLTNMDSALAPQLGDSWTIELIANDNLESMWVMCAMQPEEEQEQQQQQQEPVGVQQQEPAKQEQVVVKQEQPGAHYQQHHQHQQQQRYPPSQRHGATQQQQQRSSDRRGDRPQQQQQHPGDDDRRRSWDRPEREWGGGGSREQQPRGDRERDWQQNKQQQQRPRAEAPRGRDHDWQQTKQQTKHPQQQQYDQERTAGRGYVGGGSDPKRERHRSQSRSRSSEQKQQSR